MRKLLFTAAAAAPLVLFAGLSARAATTISDSHTTPVNTSTANAGQPDDVTITGSVTVTGPVAVTLDSNNALTNSGSITIKDVDGATGVLILGGHTGSFDNTGSINLTESYVATDTNNDGILDGAYAQGTGRFGLRLTGPGTFVGPISTEVGSAVTVQGNSSFGVSLEAPITGNLLSGAAIVTTGDNSTAFRETGGVAGKITITGSQVATGGGAIGSSFTGNVTGPLSVYTALSSTGYRLTTRSSDPTVNAALLPSDLLQSGSAMIIGANVGGGVFLAAPPANTVSTNTTTDADGDGVVDSVEAASTVSTFGSAPALLVGAAGRDVHLGAFGAGQNAYGLIVEGTITGNGVFDTNSGTGAQIGVAGGTVHIDGGLRISGTISGQGYEADATGLHIEAGAQAPQIRLDGRVAANSQTAKDSTVAALLIDPGATVHSLANTGVVAAGLSGDLASAYAVLDRSGTLSVITNNNQITAAIAPTAVGDTTLGSTVALDLSANTTGVSLVQNPNPGITTTTTNADGTTTTALTPVIPTILGDVLLGSGNDSVQILAGSVTGALNFGAGQGTLLIDGGSTYSGRLLSSGTMAVTVNNGTLQDESATTIQTSKLTIGAAGVLVVSADPVNGTSTLFNVSGPATIASGGRIGLKLLSLATGPQTFTVLKSNSLVVNTSDANLVAQTPFLFVANFHTVPDAITVDIRRRTAAEANLNPAETSAFDAIYNDLGQDSGIQNAFLGQTDQAGLASAVDQMLPDHAGGVFRALSWAAEAQGVATGEPPQGQDQAGPTRAWTQEIVLSENKDVGVASGYRILGFGAVGGYESVSPRGNALGVKFGFTTANITDPALPSDNNLGVSELSTGVYWRGAVGGLRADAQLGVGYIWTYGRREFLYSDSGGVVHRSASSNWDGYTMSGRVGLEYVANVGRLFFEPKVHVDYFRIHESGYAEQNGGTGFDLTVDGRSGDLLSVTGSLTAGMTFGMDQGFRWRPQIEVGYRDVLFGSAGTTTAQFGGGDPFSLVAESVRAHAALARIGVRFYSDYLDLLLDAGAQLADDYTDLDVHLTARTVF